MDGLNEEEQEKLSKLIDLSLSLIMHGFDEMEMQKRLELVKLVGFSAELWIEKTYGRMLDLEKRVAELEKHVKRR
jgi:hypothetical protein